MKEENYLKQELYDLIKKDNSIFEFIQESSLDGIWYWDLQNPENEWMSPKFWKVLGYDPNSMEHKSSQWQDIIFEQDLKIATENFNKHLEDPNHKYDQIVRYKHKNGTTVWIRCRGIAIRDKQGKAIRMLGAHNDLTVIMELRKELEEKKDIEDANEKLYKKAYEDYLTKLLNRRGFTKNAKYVIELAKRDETSLSLALLDLDYFKKINDTYGHAQGDELLKAVSDILLDTCRGSDIVARYGGEEFIVLMPQTGKEEAIIAIERIRLYIQNHKIGKMKNQTISCGLTTFKPSKQSNTQELLNDMVKDADEALYYVKNNGRNSVKHFSDLIRVKNI